ncbi:MAG: protein phosphatase 2C domain-containing protein [Isosphaeraceae bacterium]
MPLRGRRLRGHPEQGLAVNWDDIILDAAATDTGMRRSNNQDSHAIVRASNAEAWRNRGHLFMVADGMGAHAVGELASKMACDNIPHTYTKTKTGGAVDAITKAYREVGGLIHGRASANRDFQGMGTTCTTLLLLSEGALIAHVGDSRCYRVRKGRIDQLSFDHSMVWELMRRKLLPPDEANIAVPKNVITRSLGPDPNVEVDIEGPFAVEAGDIYVLCSDGLSGPVADPEIGAFVENFHPKDACRYLISLANLRGGLDNITVVALRIGPWIEPDTAQDVPVQTAPAPSKNGRGLAGWFKSLLAGRKGNTAAETVEEHPYRTAECPISDEFLERLSELSRRVQQHAVDHAWSLDWNQFAQFRRDEAEGKSSGNRRKTLKAIGEMIAVLGYAARFHRKAGTSTGGAASVI